MVGNIHYDAWLHWDITHRCNLNCAYCFSNVITKKTAQINKINIPALLRTLNKTNKIYKIDFTGGGEPFLIPNIIDACVKITKKHYIAFVTNLTSHKIKEFSEKIDPEKVLYIAASLHIKELERLNLLNRFIDNFLLCKRKGFNIRTTEVAYPPLLNKVKKYKKFFKKKKIELKFVHFRGKYHGKKYPSAYTKEEIRIFNLDLPKAFKRQHQKGRICNAGYNVCLIRPNGNVVACSKIEKSLGNVYKKIKFRNKLIKCPYKLCGCPLNQDVYLFNKAVKECKTISKPNNIYIFRYRARNLLNNMLKLIKNQN